jgi:hypothetical protein
MTTLGIAIKDFVKLGKAARSALKRGDLAKIEELNVRLRSTANCQLIVKNGELYVENVKRDQSPKG